MIKTVSPISIVMEFEHELSILQSQTRELATMSESEFYYADALNGYIQKLQEIHKAILAEKSRVIKPLYGKMKPGSVLSLSALMLTKAHPEYLAAIKECEQIYNNNRVIMEPVVENVNRCLCGGDMCHDEIASVMTCGVCSTSTSVQGTIFDEYQFFENRHSNNSRKSSDDSDRHCDKWLDIIQAREVVNFDPAMIDKLDKMLISEYTVGDRLRSMSELTCNRVRELLQSDGYGKYKKHAPSIRRIITAYHGDAVIPPQLTAAERHAILNEFSLDMRYYAEAVSDPTVKRMINKSVVKNKFYYPKLLAYIINQLIKDSRKRKLLECIHLQSEETDNRKDVIVQKIYELRARDNN